MNVVKACFLTLTYSMCKLVWIAQCTYSLCVYIGLFEGLHNAYICMVNYVNSQAEPLSKKKVPWLFSGLK